MARGLSYRYTHQATHFLMSATSPTHPTMTAPAPAADPLFPRASNLHMRPPQPLKEEYVSPLAYSFQYNSSGYSFLQPSLYSAAPLHPSLDPPIIPRSTIFEQAPSFNGPSSNPPSFSGPNFNVPTFNAPTFNAPTANAPTSTPGFKIEAFDGPRAEVATQYNHWAGHDAFKIDHMGIGGARRRSSRSRKSTPVSLVCQECGKSFTKPYNLKSHSRSHSSDRPFKCSKCPKAFARSHDKTRHEQLHGGVKNFRCEGLLRDGVTRWGCGKSFARSDALSRHFRTETGWSCVRALMNEAKEHEDGAVSETGRRMSEFEDGRRMSEFEDGRRMSEFENGRPKSIDSADPAGFRNSCPSLPHYRALPSHPPYPTYTFPSGSPPLNSSPPVLPQVRLPQLVSGHYAMQSRTDSAPLSVSLPPLLRH